MITSLGRKDRLSIILLWLVLIAFFLPAVWIIFTAIRPQVEVNAKPPVWIPRRITLEAFQSLLGGNAKSGSVPFWDYLRNSVSITLGTTAVSLAIGTLAGYVFARFPFRGSRTLFLGMMLARAVPGIALSLPLFVLFARMGMVNKISGLVIAYTAINVPFAAWLMDSFFREIPEELTEAAQIDGCSRWRAFLHVDLPLALPGATASAIFVFLTTWNEFQLASVLARTNASKSFPVGLFDFTTQFTVDWRGMAAMSTLMMIPAIFFVALVQRQLVRGLTSGAIK